MSKWITAATNASTPADRRKYLRKHRALQIRNEIAGCTNCALSETRINTVPFDRAKPLPIAIVGEAPGAAEDKTGKPFVGRSGQLLDTMIENAGYSRSDTVVLNAVACRPPRNRKPYTPELDACQPLFDKQLNFTGAWVVVLLGASALNRFSPNMTITDARGTPFWQAGRIYIPTFHPSYVLRYGGKRKVVEADIKMAFDFAYGEKWWEPTFIGAVIDPTDDDAKFLAQLLDTQGWVVLNATRLGDTVVVVKDDKVKVPIKHGQLARYTVEEMVRIGEMGKGPKLTTQELQQIHLVKRELTGMVVT